MPPTSSGVCIYLFGEGDRAFFRGLLDRSLLLLFLPPLIDDHMSDYMLPRISQAETLYDLEVFFTRLLGLTHLVRLRLRLLSLE